MHRYLARIVRGLEAYGQPCAQAGRRAPAVSGWSVGDHADHIVKSNAAILGLVRLDSTAPTVDAGITFLGRVVAVTGWIPRGKGKSPAAFHPEEVAPDRLQARLREQVAQFAALQPDMAAIARDPRRYAHPVFGGLTKLRWLRFVDIHQRHHLRIVRDILAASGS